MLKWIELKDIKKNKEFLTIPTFDPILDIDIKECKTRHNNFAVEEDSYKACIVNILMCLSYSYIELRHYTDAIHCLNECETIAEDNVPDLYFRRSQARTYSKYSNDDQLYLAIKDIEKTISIKKESIYIEHHEKLKNIIEHRKTMHIIKIESLIMNNIRINK